MSNQKSGAQESMQKLADKYVKVVDTTRAGKEKEVMEV